MSHLTTETFDQNARDALNDPQLRTATKQKLRGVQIVGGGSQNDYLNQATADATGLPVLAGPVEATVTGNVLVQAIASGWFASHAEARRHVAENLHFKEFIPRVSNQ